MVLRTTSDADNVLTIWMDTPGKPVNTCSPQFFDELEATLDAIDRSPPRAVIVASAKAKSFSAGADLHAIRQMTRDQIADYLSRGQRLFNRISRLDVPTVAAISGDCLGGGFELALSCHYRVAAESTSISIGLPETKLGLIPAWGGTTRLPRLIGLRSALPILLAGKTMPPRKAQRARLVDEIVRPEALLSAAKRVALSPPARGDVSKIDRAIAAIKPLGRRILAMAGRKTLATTRGHYPAPMKLLDAIQTGYDGGFDAGVAAERRAILDLSADQSTQNLLRLFFLRQSAERVASEQVHSKPHDMSHTAVIGGGTMGAGIIHALIRAGLPVRMVEVNPPAVSAALGRIKKMLDDDVAAGRLDRLAARAAFNRVSPTADWTGLELADIVIEAVLETIQAKRDVFSRLDRATRPTAVLATNTSSLRIGDIAQATLHPERVVGMHFFNPVPKMPLVEIVRGPHSDDASLATAIALSGQIGKTPVLVADGPGFLVNRILVPYLSEALRVAGEATPIDSIDEAMKDWGMPMGPFELFDEIGLDVAAHVLASLTADQAAPSNILATFERAKERGWLGKKSGRGFYIHGQSKRGKGTTVNQELIEILTAGAVVNQPASAESIQWRLVLPMVNEAAMALEEGIVSSPDTLDLAMVLGTGFAPFRGGVVQFADSVGTGEIVRRLEDLADKHGQRFAPARSLADAARDHRSMPGRDAEVAPASRALVPSPGVAP